ITEAISFGLQAGRSAAAYAAAAKQADAQSAARLAEPALTMLATEPAATDSPVNVAHLIARLQEIMQIHVGPFRDQAGLESALAEIAQLRGELGDKLQGGTGPQDPVRLDALDLRNMLMVAEAVARSALSRTESRGAHQREDYPGLDEAWTLNQTLSWKDGQWTLAKQQVERLSAEEEAVLAATEQGGQA